ncbi:uncharacterized protein LOC132174155 [Corylus avellana]|uniref:uncharacterized protein LOC132174155 n=1 Tax=Corylus avellana TaxID=13451 RepID=UPI00286A901A|nr:uncharacterized protein LOC132174155 [Corylus avellana]
MVISRCGNKQNGSVWAKSLLHPTVSLGIQPQDVHSFQISVLVLFDQIWLSRNSLIHGGSHPDPEAVLKKIRTTTLHHLHAWKSGDALSAEWLSPPPGSLKANFDVAIRPNFAVAAATLRDHEGNFLAVCSKKLPSMDANLGEAHGALLATSLAVSVGCSSLILEGDSLLSIVAIKDPHLFSDWVSAPVISDTLDLLLSIPVWSALKISRSANVCAHNVARWAASHHVFGSIPTSSSFLSSVRFRSGKDPPL